MHALLDAGLTLTALRECEPVPKRCANEPGELARRRRVPLYLQLRGPANLTRRAGSDPSG